MSDTGSIKLDTVNDAKSALKLIFPKAIFENGNEKPLSQDVCDEMKKYIDFEALSDAECTNVKLAISDYMTSVSYTKHCVVGAKRINLNGEEVEVITQVEEHLADLI